MIEPHIPALKHLSPVRAVVSTILCPHVIVCVADWPTFLLPETPPDWLRRSFPRRLPSLSRNKPPLLLRWSSLPLSWLLQALPGPFSWWELSRLTSFLLCADWPGWDLWRQRLDCQIHNPKAWHRRKTEGKVQKQFWFSQTHSLCAYMALCKNSEANCGKIVRISSVPSISVASARSARFNFFPTKEQPMVVQRFLSLK